MKFRFPIPGVAVLLVIGFTLAGAVAQADDGKGHGNDHGDTQSSDDHGDNHQSGDGANSDDGGNDSVGDSDAHEANETPQKEQEEARKAVVSGRAAPLSDLLKKLKADYPGQILDVALVTQGTKLSFVVKYIDKASRVRTVTLDALTLEDD